MKLEYAAQIVNDCILTVSRDHDSVNPDGTLENSGIITEYDLCYLRQLLIENEEIGVKSVKHELSAECVAELNKDWLVMDLVTLVRNCALIAPETVIDVDLLVRQALRKIQPPDVKPSRGFLQAKQMNRQMMLI